MTKEYELVSHPNIKHMNIFLVQLKYRTPHYHNEMELGLILKGNINIKKNLNSYDLNENDIFLLNPNESHEILSSDDGALVLSVQFSYKLFSSYFTYIKAIHFSTPKLKDVVKEQHLNNIHSLLYKLSLSYFKKETLYEIQSMIYANQLLYELLSTVPYKILSENEQNQLFNRTSRLNSITSFIENNFNRKLLLREIAERENLSLTYLSHFIKDNLGMSFQDYLKNIRFNHALHLIENTNRTMLDISLESGFSDIRYLNEVFISRYGTTPSQYRKGRKKKSETMNLSIASLQHILPLEDSIKILNQFK